jgi:hypothetical protein
MLPLYCIDGSSCTALCVSLLAVNFKTQVSISKPRVLTEKTMRPRKNCLRPPILDLVSHSPVLKLGFTPWGSTLWGTILSGYRIWIWQTTYLGRPHSGGLQSRGSHSGGLLSRATDCGFGKPLTWGDHALGGSTLWGSTLWGTTLSAYRFWIWQTTYLSSEKL